MSVPGGTLFIANLDTNVSERTLSEHFSKFGPLEEVLVCKDPKTGQSLGYALVKYKTAATANDALVKMNNTDIESKKIIIRQDNQKSEYDKNAIVLFRNLDPEVTQKLLFDYFSRFGEIVYVRLSSNSTGTSNGYGHVQFYEARACEACLATKKHFIQQKEMTVERLKVTEVMNPSVVNAEKEEEKKQGEKSNEKKIPNTPKVTPPRTKPEEKKENERGTETENLWHVNAPNSFAQSPKGNEPEQTTLYLKNLRTDLNEDTLRQTINRFGEIHSMKLGTYFGNSKVMQAKWALVQMKTNAQANDIIQNKISPIIRSLFLPGRDPYVDFKSNKQKFI
eukprot:TRINITY_DN4939_c0_g1_i4.p1 TRINITY_DN4939_c0_g1~~TRINITY_DN4939_c0_g1_i4.p1  ORF type:complete len:336 (-),score=59.54 TRINITY_DN4939_c0_g1_i4:59-1066(-)